MSKYTAPTRSAISAPARYLAENKLIIGRCLDYGCGKGFDKDFLGMDGYDPYWFPEYPRGTYDTIMCHFVLNVVTKEEQEVIIRNIKELLNPDGKVYFTVSRKYSTDRPGKGCIQRVVILPYKSIYRRNKYEIYVCEKENL